MSRYIDADKLILHLNDYKLQVSPSWKDEWERMVSCLVIDTCMDAVKEQPTADVRENVKGEWIRRDSRYVGWISFDCSVCGETLELDRETSNDFKYCPFCGAEMGGES